MTGEDFSGFSASRMKISTDPSETLALKNRKRLRVLPAGFSYYQLRDQLLDKSLRSGSMLTHRARPNRLNLGLLIVEASHVLRAVS